MSENTFPIYTADAIVNFYRTEVLTGQEAKHFTKSDLTPSPKVPFRSRREPDDEETWMLVRKLRGRVTQFLLYT